MVVPECQVIHTTTLRLVSSADECEALGDVANDGWMNLDRFLNEHERVENERRLTFSASSIVTSQCFKRSYESFVGECVMRVSPASRNRVQQ